MQNNMNNNQNNSENNNFTDSFHDTAKKAASGINDAASNFVNKPRLPGEKEAIVSLVLGIIAVVLMFAGAGVIASIVLGIVGLVFASKSKKLGFTGGIRTAGFVLSLVGIVIGAILFIIISAIIGFSTFALLA